MNMMFDKEVVCKAFDSANAWEGLTQLVGFLLEAKAGNTRVDQIEREMLVRLLEMGRQLLESFVQSVGDVGETVEHAQHGSLRRSAQQHTRQYQSIFCWVRDQPLKNRGTLHGNGTGWNEVQDGWDFIRFVCTCDENGIPIPVPEDGPNDPSVPSPTPVPATIDGGLDS